MKEILINEKKEVLTDEMIDSSIKNAMTIIYGKRYECEKYLSEYCKSSVYEFHSDPEAVSLSLERLEDEDAQRAAMADNGKLLSKMSSDRRKIEAVEKIISRILNPLFEARRTLDPGFPSIAISFEYIGFSKEKKASDGDKVLKIEEVFDISDTLDRLSNVINSIINSLYAEIKGLMAELSELDSSIDESEVVRTLLDELQGHGRDRFRSRSLKESQKSIKIREIKSKIRKLLEVLTSLFEARLLTISPTISEEDYYDYDSYSAVEEGFSLLKSRKDV